MTEGFSWRDLLDYEDGLTLTQLTDLNVEVGRLSLVRERREVTGMVLAISTLVDQKIFQKYNAEIDSLLRSSRVPASRLRSSSFKEKRRGKSAYTEAELQAQFERAAHTVRELNKLNVLLR